MKIKELKTNFSEILVDISFVYEEIKDSGNAKFSNLINFRNGINKLEKLLLLNNETKAIKKTGIFSTTENVLILNLTEARKLKIPMENLRTIVSALSNTFDDISTSTKENSISIKLPTVNDFEDLSKTSTIIHKILSQTILNEEINGQVKIYNVDSGSIWIDVYLGTASALTLIAGLTWSSAVIYKKIQEGRIIENHVKSLNIKNDSLKEIQDAQKKSIDLIINAEAEQLYSENFNSNNQEQITRLKHSIKLLSELIDKGAEIHPALNAPENVSNLFPNMKNVELIESKIKKLKE